ncbi:MAG: hypothetical protein CVU39_15935 [Chloroflexi bacterium HGW-Chloroflexi-10]|nr:MAG: hypothetical protein CVU39_15935 [Chloroflexi bacterium HGW-Chloroflexi-10]
MATTRANRDLMRAINRSIILSTIKTQGLIARAEVARVTGLSPASVTGITAELIEEGLIYEKASGDSSGGRPPILLAINPLGGYVVGIKLMEDHAIGALTDLSATILQRYQLPLHDRSAEHAIEIMAELVENLLILGAVSRNKLIGVGVGLAGIVDSNEGVLRQSPYFGWRNFAVRDRLQQLVDSPVCVDNDVNTFTLAERWYGTGQGVDNFLTITIGRGVGLGVVTHGQFYRGVHGGAGELGHTVVNPQGPLCDCGKHGCLEAFVSDPALISLAQQSYQAGEISINVQNIEQIVVLADNGSLPAQRIMGNAGAIFGQSIANMINIFNPSRILVSGEGVRNGKWFFNAMHESIRVNTMPSLYADVDIRVEPWGDDVWARGAASLVLRQLFESPVGQENSFG